MKERLLGVGLSPRRLRPRETRSADETERDKEDRDDSTHTKSPLRPVRLQSAMIMCGPSFCLRLQQTSAREVKHLENVYGRGQAFGLFDGGTHHQGGLPPALVSSPRVRLRRSMRGARAAAAGLERPRG